VTYLATPIIPKKYSEFQLGSITPGLLMDKSLENLGPTLRGNQTTEEDLAAVGKLTHLRPWF